MFSRVVTDYEIVPPPPPVPAIAGPQGQPVILSWRCCTWGKEGKRGDPAAVQAASTAHHFLERRGYKCMVSRLWGPARCMHIYSFTCLSLALFKCPTFLQTHNFPLSFWMAWPPARRANPPGWDPHCAASVPNIPEVFALSTCLLRLSPLSSTSPFLLASFL